MKKEKLRAIMILNEVEVDIARIVKFDPDFNNLKEKIAEVRDIMLVEEYPIQEARKVDWEYDADGKPFLSFLLKNDE